MSNPGNETATSCRLLKLGSNFVKNTITFTGDSHQEYMLKVLLAEVEYRELKRRDLNLKKAGFGNIKTFENYHFEDIELPAGMDRELLIKADFLNRRENLILYGRNGTGKSHMATAIGKLLQYLKKFEKLDLLICDEWGYIPFDTEGSQLLFQVIADCYEKRSIIITTNLEFSRWNGIFYDDQLTASLIDRLVHHSHLIIFDRESWRFKHSLMQQK